MISIALFILAAVWGFACYSEATYKYTDTVFLVATGVVSVTCIFLGVMTIGV